MSNIIKFEEADNNENILRIGGNSFLPHDMEWPTNPNGDKLTFIVNLPVNFLNLTNRFHYPSDMVISVFTTYNPADYFLDSIVYHGDVEELDNIKKGFTRVILHSIGLPRNDSEFLIPAKKISIDEKKNDSDDYCGSLFGRSPVFLQRENLELHAYEFCMQISGEDFPEEFQNIFYLQGSVGYLFLCKEKNSDEAGLFFTQCT